MKILHSIIIILTVTGFNLILNSCTSSTSRNDKIQEQLRSEVDIINKKSLQQISESIRFDSCVLHKNNDMEYYYTYTDSIKPDNTFFKSIEDEAVRIVKNDPGMTDMRSYGISTKYVYRDKGGNRLYTFEITPDDYK